MNTIFTDMLGNITIASGVVRMDLMNIKNINRETNKPEFEVSQSLAMPIEGLLRSLEQLEHVRKELIEKGVLKLNDKS